MKIITRCRIYLYAFFLLAFITKASAQTSQSYWKESNEKFRTGESSSIVDTYRSVHLDLAAMQAALSGAILEDLPNAFTNGPVVSLPLPDGSFANFRVALSTLMPKPMMAQFPMIRAFTAKGIDDPSAVAQLDYTQWGFHAMILSHQGTIIIDPASLGNTSDYICFDRRNSRRAQNFICETLDSVGFQRIANPNSNVALRSSGGTLRTYRLALSCTGEYAAYYGGTVSGALSGIVTSINRVDGVYKSEVDIHLVLIANNSSIVYTNAATDPFTNGNGGTMLGENQTTCDGVIGNANYDIGHVFSTGGGGVAYLRVPCVAGSKAGGVTGSSAPIGDAYDIDYVAHEMGHQFGGNHTFNSTTGSCSGNRASTAAYEPGSGTTIMAYAGICGADDIQPHSDAIFHTKSFDEIQDFITTGSGNTCAVATSTGNTPPVATVGSNYTIPFNTPFTLRGSGSDVNGDVLTYLWEEYDLGPSGAPNSPSGNAPIFRDWVPVSDTFRIFPRIQDLVRNVQTKGEILPSYARTLNFRFTVRDNRTGGGGVTHNDTPVILTVTNTTTPFSVTSPNTAVTWAGGSSQTVTWNVSSTNVAPISCANVKIMLSVDSGYTYPYTLLASTANDGTEVVTIPNVASTKARVKVESIGNVFFDISNVNFTITAATSLSSISTSALASNSLCAGGNVNVTFTTNGPANAGNIFTAQLSDASGNFASPVSIGTLASVNAGTIAATIPGGTAAGTGYRIRVVSSNPVVTGTDNGTNITISLPVGTPGTITGIASVCQGQAGVVYSVPAVTNATGYVWSLPSGASITSGSNTNSITVTYSGGATSGNVTVTGTNAGCGNGPASAPLAVTVNTSGAASVSITANPGNSICSGTNVTFTATPVNGGTTPSYQWKIGTTNVGTNSATYSNNALTNGNAVSCVMTSNAACATGSPATSNTITMTVNANVNASVGITANPGNTICSGTNVTFTAVPVNGGTTPSYQWKIGTTNVGTNSATYSNSALTNGNAVSCVMTSNAACVSGSPATSNAITMTVNPSVAASVSITANPGNTICAGTNVTFTAVSVNGGTTPSYQWKIGTTNVGTNSTTYSNNALANGNSITCVMTSNATCATGSPATSNAIAMTVNPNVASSVSITANPGNTICAGTTVTFTATPVNGGTTPSYQWKIGSTNVGTNSATYSSNSLANGDAVSCVMTSNATCATGNPASSNTISMTVNPNVAASVSITPNPGNTICAGTNVTFTATPVNGGTIPSYQWKIGTTNVGTNSATYSNSSLLNGNSVTCIMTSNATCATGSPATSNAITMTVNPNLATGVTIAANPGNTICAGTNVTFTATPVNGGTTPSYQWKIGSTNVGTNSVTYSNSSLANGDAVTCIMTSNATCAVGSPATSNLISMTVNPNLSASVSITANPGNTICAGTNVNFTASPVNGGTTPSYQWKLGTTNVGTNSATYSNNALVNGNAVSCIMTSNATCATGSPATSNAITMTVNPVVAASVSITANPGNTICAGTNVTFTASPVNGGTTPSYQWKIGTTNVGTNSATYANNSLANGNAVSCIMTSNAACATGSPAASNAITMTVNPVVAASVNITANPGNTICAGTNVTFIASPVNGGTTPTYQWKLGSTNVGTNSVTYANNALTNGNSISCVMTSNAACVTGSPATSNAIAMTVSLAPTVSTVSPGSGSPGTLVTISGSNFTGANSVKFNGVSAAFTVVNSGQITTTVPAGATTGLIAVTTPCGTVNSSGNFTVTGNQVTLNLKLYLEGYYQQGFASGGLMNNNGSGGLLYLMGYSPNPTDVDTVYISAMNASTHALVEKKSGILKTDGTVSVTFGPSVIAGTQYYIKVNHRNTIETWSSTAVLLTNVYDFTMSQSKAYGNNMIQNFDGSGWAFFSGDISDAFTGVIGVQDGVVESQDYSDMESAVTLTLSGYRTEDITGDGVVESSDYSLMENNVYYSRSVMKP